MAKALPALATAAIRVVRAAGFAAAHAEDVLAGRQWFFGWIGASAALTTAFQVAIRRLAARG